MLKSKLFLWLFSVIAGLALGIFIYSYSVWTTNIPVVFSGYWFGMSNFNMVFIITGLVLLTYLAFLIVLLFNRNIHSRLKVWLVVGMLVIAGLTKFTLSFSQQFQETNRLDIETDWEQLNNEY